MPFDTDKVAHLIEQRKLEKVGALYEAKHLSDLSEGDEVSKFTARRIQRLNQHMKTIDRLSKEILDEIL